MTFNEWWGTWWRHDAITQTRSPLEIATASWNAALAAPEAPADASKTSAVELIKQEFYRRGYCAGVTAGRQVYPATHAALDEMAANALKRRHEQGDRLTPAQVSAYKAALRTTEEA